jgi:hypothetical protein
VAASLCLSRGRRVALDLGVFGLQFLLLELCRAFHGVFDLGAHVRNGDHDQAGGAGVQVLAQLLEIVTAHPGRGMTSHCAEDRAARGRRCEQPTSNSREREEHDHQPCRPPDAASQDAADAGGRLVLLDDLDPAIVATLDDGRVPGVDQARLGVEAVHELIVGLCVLHTVIDPNERHQCVNCHQ